MKEKYFLGLILLFVLLGCVACGTEEEVDDSTGTYGCIELQSNYHADIMIYNGDNEPMPSDFVYREIGSVGADALSVQGDSGYGCIVILDRKGQCEMSEEDLVYLKQFSETNRYDIMYYGTARLEQFVQLKYEKSAYETDRGLFYLVACNDIMEYNAAGNPYACHGLWTDEDESCVEEDPEYIQYGVIFNLLYGAREVAKYEESKMEDLQD